jgi:hypothetical protein
MKNKIHDELQLIFLRVILNYLRDTKRELEKEGAVASVDEVMRRLSIVIKLNEPING